MRPCSQYSITIKFIQSRYIRDDFIRAITMNVYVVKEQGRYITKKSRPIVFLSLSRIFSSTTPYYMWQKYSRHGRIVDLSICQIDSGDQFFQQNTLQIYFYGLMLLVILSLDISFAPSNVKLNICIPIIKCYVLGFRYLTTFCLVYNS